MNAKASGRRHQKLERSMGLFSVTMIGVGAMIGAGIFVLTGIAAGVAGPALILAFLLNGIVALFTAMSYAELGSAIPEAGGGYLWVKKALPSVNGFLSGWMSWFAHAVAGSLYALGFGAYFGLLLSTFSVGFLGLPQELFVKVFAVVAILVFTFINFFGSSETGKVANIVAIVKIAILAVFIVSGLLVIFGNPQWPAKFEPFAPFGGAGILIAMGLTFIAFEGYEIIVQAGEEIKDPKRNIPRAVFLSLAIVIPIYLLVAFVAIGAVSSGSQPTFQFLAQHKELGLAEAANQFMPFGLVLLLVGGLVSTLSALNATTFSSTRVSFAMGRDYNLPNFFRQIHERTKVPHKALFVSSALMILMAVALPIEDVASATDLMFLLLFLQVNVATIVIRRRWGDRLDYGFKTPFFPLPQVLSIVAMVALAVFLFFYSPRAWFGVIAWVLVGVFVYRFYAVEKEKIEKTKELREESGKRFRVVVALDSEKQLSRMSELAACIAKGKKREVVALNVLRTSPKQILKTNRGLLSKKSALLDRCVSSCARFGVKAYKKFVHSRNPNKAILDFVRERDVDMLFLGWSGRIYINRIFGSVQELILRKTNCTVAIVKSNSSAEIMRVVVPLRHSGDEDFFRAKQAAFIANALGAEMVLFAASGSRKEKESFLSAHKAFCSDLGVKAKSIVVLSRNFGNAILANSNEHDLLVLGPSREWILKRFLFGSVNDRVSDKCRGTVLLLKRPEHKIETYLSLLLSRLGIGRGA